MLISCSATIGLTLMLLIQKTHTHTSFFRNNSKTARVILMKKKKLSKTLTFCSTRNPCRNIEKNIFYEILIFCQNVCWLVRLPNFVYTLAQELDEELIRF